MIRYLSGGANSLKRLIVTLDEIYKQNGWSLSVHCGNA
jgi:hypothetical protein